MYPFRLPPAEVLAQVGLEVGSANFETPNQKLRFLAAALVGFNDGDSRMYMNDLTTPLDARLYGKDGSVSTGKIAQVLGRAAARLGSEPGTIRGFQEYVADEYTGGLLASLYPRERLHPIGISTDAVQVEGHPRQLQRTPLSVVEYGACPFSTALITDLHRVAAAQQSAGRFVPITPNHFSNHLLHRAAARHNTTRHSTVEVAPGYESGMHAGIDALATDNSVVEAADLVICDNGHSKDWADMVQSVQHADRLLRSGGALIIRTQVSPRDTAAIRAPELASQALSNGLSASGVHHSPPRAVRHTHYPGQPEVIESVVIFKK